MQPLVYVYIFIFILVNILLLFSLYIFFKGLKKLYKLDMSTFFLGFITLKKMTRFYGKWLKTIYFSYIK